MPLRGGAWYERAAGVFALSLCDSRLLPLHYAGFRAALSLCQVLKPYGVLASNQGIKGSVPVPQGKKNKNAVEAAGIFDI